MLKCRGVAVRVSGVVYECQNANFGPLPLAVFRIACCFDGVSNAK